MTNKSITNKPITVVYLDESFKLKSALISGRTNEIFSSSTSLYCGPLDLDEIHTALFFTNRAVIKLLKEEFDIELENCEAFLYSALVEALTKEWNIEKTGEDDIDVRKTRRFRGDNHN